MKIVTGICGGLLVSGLALGWWLLGDFSGSAAGLFLSACLALPLYWLSTRNAARRGRPERTHLLEIVPAWLNRGRKQA